MLTFSWRDLWTVSAAIIGTRPLFLATPHFAWIPESNYGYFYARNKFVIASCNTKRTGRDGYFKRRQKGVLETEHKMHFWLIIVCKWSLSLSDEKKRNETKFYHWNKTKIKKIRWNFVLLAFFYKLGNIISVLLNLLLLAVILNEQVEIGTLSAAKKVFQ